jgi:hypothetical protein
MTMHRSETRGLRLRRNPTALLALSLCTALACQPETTTPAEGSGDTMRPVPMDGSGSGNMGSMSSSGSGSGSSGSALVKFCNAVASDKGPVEVEVDIGGTKLKALSGACAPAKGESCSSIRAGRARVTFRMGGKDVLSEEIGLEAGQQYLVFSTVDRASQKLSLGGGKLTGGMQCQSADPFPAGSTPGNGEPIGKFCHSVSVGGGGNAELDLDVGGVRMKAATRGCSSAQGQACLALPTGMQMATLYHNGEMVTTKSVTIDKGSEYLFGVDLDASNTPVITVKSLGAGTCSNSGSSSNPGTTPGTMPPTGSNMTGVKVCNNMSPGTGDVIEIQLGAVTIKANRGQCAPVKGQACQQLPSGPTMASVFLDGEPIGDGTVNLPAGRDVVFVADDMGVNGLPVPTGMMCSDYEP